jgi:hypothetical protein
MFRFAIDFATIFPLYGLGLAFAVFVLVKTMSAIDSTTL